MHDLMASDPAKDDQLILVDGFDREIGSATKLQAHLESLLHRAFSVILVRDGDDGRELLLAKRSELKYHSAGLWANSCCSHPRLGEQVIDAAYRRVHEELGCEASNLEEIAAFVYRAEFDNGIYEHEYDHVLVGECLGDLALDPYEASDARWVSFESLAEELTEQRGEFAVWAPVVLTLTMRRFSE